MSDSIAPKSVGLNVRMNENAAARLIKAGVKLVEKSVETMQAQATTRAAEARDLGVKNGVRTDASGNVQFDSGRKLWGDDGLVLGLTSQIPADLAAAGYVLEKAYIAHKAGDRMCQLRLWWSKAPETAFATTPAMQVQFDALLASAFEHVHGFSNPDGSLTLNLSHRVDGPPSSSVKTVRFTPDGTVTAARV